MVCSSDTPVQNDFCFVYGQYKCLIIWFETLVYAYEYTIQKKKTFTRKNLVKLILFLLLCSFTEPSNYNCWSAWISFSSHRY